MQQYAHDSASGDGRKDRLTPHDDLLREVAASEAFAIVADGSMLDHYLLRVRVYAPPGGITATRQCLQGVDRVDVAGREFAFHGEVKPGHPAFHEVEDFGAQVRLYTNPALFGSSGVSVACGSERVATVAQNLRIGVRAGDLP